MAQGAEVAFCTGADEAGLRLDQVVMRHTGWSRRLSRLAIHAGQVAVAGAPARIVARRLPAGASLRVGPAAAPAPALGVAPAPGLVSLGRRWLVANKPAGLLSEPDRFGAPALPQRLAELLAARGERDLRLFLVHRLDAATSGLVVLARRPQVAARLGAAFAQRRVQKVYLALCAGHLKGERCLDGPVGRLAGTRHAVMASGRAAETYVRPVGRRGGATLLEVRPTTGRTHQIRVHLSHLGHPLVGDRLYGGPLYAPDGAPVPSLCLHAHRLGLPDPEADGGAEAPLLCFEAPPPAHFLWAERAFSS